MPTGYDRYSKTQFGNRDFLVNAILWLTDDNGLLTLRHKSVTLRLLNDRRAHDMRSAIQAISLITPLLLLLITGLCITLTRKHMYRQ